MNYKQFKNNNFNIKADEPNQNLLEDLCNCGSLDFAISGDEGCASNYEMYYPLINYNTVCEYLVTDTDIERYKQGYTVKLIARELTEEELEKFLEGGY